MCRIEISTEALLPLIWFPVFFSSVLENAAIAALLKLADSCSLPRRFRYSLFIVPFDADIVTVSGIALTR